MADALLVVTSPASAEAWDAAGAICREYVQSLGVDLSFQAFEAELLAMPALYAPPRGRMLLARVDGVLAACGAFRPLAELDAGRACEMKRMYVRPAFRGLGLGRRIATTLMEAAAQAGYASMFLDTLEKLDAARALYASLGFAEVERYNDNPLPGVRFFRAQLASRP